MTREAGKGSSSISLSNVIVQPKSICKYPELWNKIMLGVTVTNWFISVCVLDSWMCLFPWLIHLQTESSKSKFQSCQTPLCSERENPNFPSSTSLYLSVSDSFWHSSSNRYASVICCHGNCCQYEHQLLWIPAFKGLAGKHRVRSWIKCTNINTVF